MIVMVKLSILFRNKKMEIDRIRNAWQISEMIRK